MLNNKKSDVGRLAAVLGAGLAAGAVIGTALSNEKTRERIKNTTNRAIKKAKEMRNNETEATEEFQVAPDEIKNEAKKKYENEKRKMGDPVSEKEDPLS